MSDKTKIEWCDHTFNPWIGCMKVSPGCDHCYAETWDARGMQQQESRWGPHAMRTRTSAANWRKPLAWNRKAEKAGKRARVFCASLADVFDNHRSILPEWRADLWALIEATPYLDWLLLTKRPQNIGNMLPVPFDFEKHYPNVWLGTTVENQTEADRRIPDLLATPAAVRFVSAEPLLGPVDLLQVAVPRPELRASVIWDALRGSGGAPSGLDWVIVGGESGPGARPMHPDWARSLRDQCNAAGVAFFFKQWGEWAPDDGPPRNGVDRVIEGRDACAWWNGTGWTINENGYDVDLNAAKGSGEWLYHVGKTRAGRLLDSREWNEMPGDVR